MKQLGHWFAEARVGRVLFRLIVLGLVVAFATAFVLIVRQHDIDQITQRIEVIERVEPSDVLRECLRDPECRQLLRRVPDLLRESREGVVAQPPPSAGQQPGPGSQPGSKDGDGGKEAKPKEAPPEQRDEPPTVTKPPLPTPDLGLPSPGKSGETPADDKSQGVKACVESAVSACVDADIRGIGGAPLP